jgi:hypothetical protein
MAGAKVSDAVLAPLHRCSAGITAGNPGDVVAALNEAAQDLVQLNFGPAPPRVEAVAPIENQDSQDRLRSRWLAGRASLPNVGPLGDIAAD